jgi:hypothetical protein
MSRAARPPAGRAEALGLALGQNARADRIHEQGVCPLVLPCPRAWSIRYMPDASVIRT